MRYLFALLLIATASAGEPDVVEAQAVETEAADAPDAADAPEAADAPDAAQASSAPSWKRTPVPDSTVSVDLPGVVELRHAERSTPVGRVISDTLVVEPDGGWMAATVTHAPRLALRVAGSKTVMRQARNSVLEDTKGEQSTWFLCARDGREGMRLTFTLIGENGAPQQGVSEIFTFDGLVITLTSALEPRSAELTERFHSSIKFQ